MDDIVMLSNAEFTTMAICSMAYTATTVISSNPDYRDWYRGGWE